MKPFRITSLEAHQIGPFGDLKMSFPEKPDGMEDKAEIHILTGENGVGKTTVLEMLSFVFYNNQNSGYVDGMEEWFLDKCRDLNRREIIKVDFSSIPPASLPVILESGRFHKHTHSLHVRDFRDNLRNLNYEFHFAVFCYSGHRHIKQVKVDSITEFSHAPFEDALNFIHSIYPKVIVQWIANTIAKEAIAKSQNELSQARKFRKSIDNLENAISQIIEEPIRFFLDSDPLKVKIEVNQERLDFNLLPDGLKSIVSWLADLLMRMDRVKWVDDIPVFERNFILFLDEIEVHMHPKWQRKILPAVQGLFPNAQIFISTHSPFVVGSVDGAWVHRLVKPNGDSVPDGEPFLSEDGKSVLHVLEEVFGVTEQFGPNVERDLKQFYSLRDEVLKGKNGEQTDALLKAGRELAVQSTELHQIIEMEIRQVNHRKKLNLSL